MDLLVFDGKQQRNLSKVPVSLSKRELAEILGEQKVDAHLNGGIVQIFDEIASRILHEIAGIGQWLDDERKESQGVSRTCFRSEHRGETSKEEQSWSEQSPGVPTLVLSSLETVLLSIDWRIIRVRKGDEELTDQEVWLKMKDYDGRQAEFAKLYAVYRFLKSNGWIVSSGHTFGCDFLIYCLGAQYYHSSAGVLVADEISPQRLLTLTRILAHNKKALILTTTSDSVQSFEDVEKVEVKIVTMKTYFLERDVAQMSIRQNELYQLKCLD